MNDSPLSTSIEYRTSQLAKFRRLVQQYATTLDLSSPDVVERFEEAIARTGRYDAFLGQGFRVLDIGSGAGLPAIPIAIRRPDLEITLCEVRNRRAAFLERATTSLNLFNTRVYNGDVQRLEAEPFDAVIAQAVGRLSRIFTLCQHLLRPTWTILTRKGGTLESEIEEMKRVAGQLSVETHRLDDGTTLTAIHGGEA